MFKKTAILVVSCGAVLAGCGTDLQSENQEIISNLEAAGYPASDIQVVNGDVYVQRDAHVTLEASREMIQTVKTSSEEQYRTTNTVDTSVVHKICIVPTTQFNSYSMLSAGLDAAIANYNNENLAFTMVRGSFSDCDATITAKTSTATGGSSGFPSGGKPYGTINIGTPLQNYSSGVNKHVITHELGHCIGFRHADYYDRSISCGGSPSNEGDAGVGAILLPGTPSTAKVGGSIMNACFRTSETGSWSSSDKTALHDLY